MVAADHGACRVGFCRHGHVDFCPTQKGYKKPRKSKPKTIAGLELRVEVLNGGNDVNVISEGVYDKKSGSTPKYLGSVYRFHARNEQGEAVLMKAFSDMLRHYSPEDIAHFISEIRK